jgi:hypothetical protein
MRRPEYIEGPEAHANFERLATAVLRAPKTKKQQDKPTASEKKQPKSDRD